MRRLVSLLGELLVTAGMVLMLFAAYQLFWTNVQADRASSSALSQLDKAWAAAPVTPPAPATLPSAGPAPGPASGSTASTAAPAPPVREDVTEGSVRARIRIPRLGVDWVQPIVEGTGDDDLAKGIGHYLGTAGPGAVGNFALAGHRATHGEPWRDLDRMRTGDRIVVETRTTVYTYVVTEPWRLVPPSDRSVIAPVPGRPSQAPTERLITLTTCHPRWSSAQRLIVPGELQSATPRDT